LWLGTDLQNQEKKTNEVLTLPKQSVHWMVNSLGFYTSTQYWSNPTIQPTLPPTVALGSILAYPFSTGMQDTGEHKPLHSELRDSFHQRIQIVTPSNITQVFIEACFPTTQLGNFEFGNLIVILIKYILYSYQIIYREIP
jgi:hypothetical protein